MKLATLQDGSRDGQLAVVARDMASAHFASGIASTLQQVLDDWNFLSPQLEDLYATLNGGKARHAFAFDPRQCMAPLPRACQWLEAAAQAESGVDDVPLLAQRASDDFSGAHDDAVFASVDDDIDFGAAVAVVTADVAAGTLPDQALDSVRLLLLANGWSLRKLAAAELASGFGAVQSRPATAFGPVAVTPDEVGAAWRGGRLHLALESSRNGERVGHGDAGLGMRFHFGELIAHAAATRRLRAGSVVGSGTVGTAGIQGRDRDAGCIADRRALEAAGDGGVPHTAFLQFGDRIRIDMLGADGLSVCGAIDQRVAQRPQP